MRLIDADELKELIDWTFSKPPFSRKTIKHMIDMARTVDALPVRHGKWIKLDMHAHLADHKCTACGQECYVPTCMGEPMYTYCPNCGARMDEDEID